MNMKQNELIRKIYWISAVLAVVILVFLASVIFLNPSSVGNPGFVWNINLWAVAWALNFILVLVLSFILARNLIKLFFEYQANRLGSRIKTKLIVTLITFSLFPALMMAFLAFGLINQNLRQWFSSPSEQLLESSNVITRNYYDQVRVFRLSAVEVLAEKFLQDPERTQGEFEQFVSEYGFNALLLIDGQGRPMFQQGSWVSVILSDEPAALPRSRSVADELLKPARQQALSGQKHYVLERGIRLAGSESIVDYGIVSVPVAEADGVVQGALLADFVISQSIAFHSIQVDEATTKYEAIKAVVDQLELNYLSILGLTTLAVLFSFVWLGTYIARKITVPLEALAEGSRELAEGNFDHRVDVAAIDELGILVQSFNQMAGEIKHSREKLEEANAELTETNVQLDERRSYIETILHNIATGVISVDESDVVHAVNEAALKMFQVSREDILNRPMREFADPELNKEFAEMKKRARLYGTYRREVTFRRGEQQQHVAATITSNLVPLQKKVEYLIVLDDLTELIRAEKFAAWQEVARRLAHEIKNPLTPIQLCAERLVKRFEQVSATQSCSSEIEEFQKILGEAVRIIVTEAQTLKSLVEEFSRFARLPICKLEDIQLHQLIDQTLKLYDGGLARVNVTRMFDPKIENVKVDPQQMQRVFINLIDNSLDALAESESDRRILIQTQFNEGHDSVTIEFQDNGVGISPRDYEHLFLPYFSRKKKGTGLGLAIVRQIVSEHKGFVRARPNHPAGTRFILELPLG